MTQITLWLLPLLVGSVFGIASSFRAKINWSWGMMLQHAIVLLISVLGLYVLPRYDWLFAWLGWLFLLSFTVLARILSIKMTQALGLLRTEQAISIARILRFCFWGPPGKYWVDLCKMIQFYLKGDSSTATAIYEKWKAFGLPKSIADNLTAYAMIGLLVTRDWEAVIQKFHEAEQRFESTKDKKKARFPHMVAVPAARAFNELERYREAAAALELADLPASNYGRDSLETVFLSFFAMLGDEEDVIAVLNSMRKNKGGLPEYARLYWHARCRSARADYAGALEIFTESLEKTPKQDLAWRERTESQIEFAKEKLASGNEVLADLQLAEKEGAAAVARGIRHRCMQVSEVLNSKQQPRAVHVLSGIISIVFILTDSAMVRLMQMGDSFTKMSHQFFLAGVLQGPLVLQGQWWRLVSYQFLHGGIAHLMMNLFGLVWFGRYVENLYGPLRFLIVFLGSGILSGLMEISVSMNEPAVGASGAVLGVFGAGMAATLKLKDVLPPSVRKHELTWMIALAVTQLFFDQFANHLFPAKEGNDAIRIAAAAHFGGMLSGFILGWLIPLQKLGTDKVVNQGKEA